MFVFPCLKGDSWGRAGRVESTFGGRNLNLGRLTKAYSDAAVAVGCRNPQEEKQREGCSERVSGEEGFDGALG